VVTCPKDKYCYGGIIGEEGNVAHPCPTHSSTLNQTGRTEYTACVAEAGYYYTQDCALQCGVCATSDVYDCLNVYEDTRRQLYVSLPKQRKIQPIGKKCRCPGNLMPCNANYWCPGGALPSARK